VDTIVNKNQSFVINARAGARKSTLIKMLQTKLTVLGRTHVSLAPTNKACRVIDGKTIHKFVIESSKKSLKEMKIDYIIIDEISMVAEKFYKFVVSLKRVRPDIKFIISGDLNNYCQYVIVSKIVIMKIHQPYMSYPMVIN
jgi:ATP-dependent exoDNAse (exonuclease V) alpha subunit